MTTLTHSAALLRRAHKATRCLGYASLLTLCALLCVPATADIVGFRVGADIWAQEWDGTHVSDGGSPENLDSALDSTEANTSLYAAIEHPLPLLPNFAVRRTDIDIDERSDRNFTLDGSAITTNTDIEIDLSHEDVVLYYELIDLVISLDLGLTLRHFDGGATFREGGSTIEKIDVDGWVPLVYAAGGIALPFTGWSVNAEVNALDFNDTRNVDIRVGLGWEIALGFAIELGYRRFELEHEDDDKTLDATVEGAYGSVRYRF